MVISQRRFYLGITAIALLTFLSYANVFKNGYIWDDDVYVTDTHLADSQGLKKIWTDPSATDHPYYPLTHTSFWLEYQIWQYSPIGSHAVNVVIHLANALLIYFIFAYLSVRGAWLCAVIFAVHPVAVESVAWVAERKNVLSAMFYLSSMFSYLYAISLKEDRKGSLKIRGGFYGLSLLLFLCSLLSKTSFCTLPVALLLLIWWKKNHIKGKDVFALMPFFIMAFILGLFTVYLEKNQVGAHGPEWTYSFLERCLIAGRALWFYSGKIIWPRELIFMYPQWDINASAWGQYLYPLAAVLIILFLWLMRNRIGKGPLVGVLLFVTNLLPALGFIDFFLMRYTFVADHLQYLACLGLIALLPSAWYLLMGSYGRGRIKVGVSGIILVILCGVTW